MRVRPHVVVVVRPRRDRAEMVKKQERTDGLALAGWKHPTHLKTAAQALGAWRNEDRPGRAFFLELVPPDLFIRPIRLE